MHVHFVGEDDDGISVSSHHARALVEAGIEASFDDQGTVAGSACRHADVVHLVTYEQMDNSLLRRMAAIRASGTPIVRFWTGRDVLWARFHEGTRQVGQALARLGVTQLCRTAAMVDQLAAVGIPASCGPILSLNLTSGEQPEPLPVRFTVLCYLPSRRRTFYGGELIDALIRRLPDVRFLILGDEATDYSLGSNAESLGFVKDISRTIRRSTVTVQPRLDGTLSRLTLEMLCHGRHAVTTHPWPYCRQADSLEGFVKALRALRLEQVFNLEGREEVCRAHDRALSLAALQDILARCSEAAPLDRKLRGGWVALAAALRNPGILSRKTFDPPDLDILPPEAAALRTLLNPQADDVVAGRA